MLIREVCSEDYPGVRALMAQVHALHAGARPDIYRPAFDMAQSEFDALCGDGRGFALAAIDECGKAVGLCVAVVRETGGNPKMVRRRVLFIDELCVDEAHRRQGIGRRLYGEARRRGLLLGVDSVELMVWSFNESAMAFYKSLSMTPRSVILEDRP